MIRERLIHIHYDDEMFKSKDNFQVREFCHALGKISSYAISKPSGNGPLDYISISIDQSGNLSAGFYSPEDTADELKKSMLLWDTLSKFQLNEPSLISAKVEADGINYAF